MNKTYTLQKEVIDLAVNLRRKGLPLKDIEQAVADAGYRHHTGSRIHNAQLSSAIVRADPSLRVRAPSGSRKQSKRKSQKTATTSSKKAGRVSDAKKVFDALIESGSDFKEACRIVGRMK